jgi:hypothetical protein
VVEWVGVGELQDELWLGWGFWSACIKRNEFFHDDRQYYGVPAPLLRVML